MTDKKKVDRKILIENGMIFTRFTSYGVLSREAVKKTISTVLNMKGNEPVMDAYSGKKQRYRYKIYVENHKVDGYEHGTPENLDGMKEVKLIVQPGNKKTREITRAIVEERKDEIFHLGLEIYEKIAQDVAEFAEMKFRAMWSVKGFGGQWTNAYKRTDMVEYFTGFFKRYGPPIVKVEGTTPIRPDKPFETSSEPVFENDESVSEKILEPKKQEPSVSYKEYLEAQAAKEKARKEAEEKLNRRARDKKGRIILTERHEPDFKGNYDLYALSPDDEKAYVRYEPDTGLRLDDANSILTTREGISGKTIYQRKYNEKLGPRDYKLKPVL